MAVAGLHPPIRQPQLWLQPRQRYLGRDSSTLPHRGQVSLAPPPTIYLIILIRQGDWVPEGTLFLHVNSTILDLLSIQIFFHTYRPWIVNEFLYFLFLQNLKRKKKSRQRDTSLCYVVRQGFSTRGTRTPGGTWDLFRGYENIIAEFASFCWKR